MDGGKEGGTEGGEIYAHLNPLLRTRERDGEGGRGAAEEALTRTHAIADGASLKRGVRIRTRRGLTCVAPTRFRGARGKLEMVCGFKGSQRLPVWRRPHLSLERVWTLPGPNSDAGPVPGAGGPVGPCLACANARAFAHPTICDHFYSFLL